MLEAVNELLCPDMPEKMFVTCLYAVLERDTGRLRFANAGHNLPYVSTEGGPIELRATGMPLGLLPGMTYEEKEAVLAPGEVVLLHSDGLAEAHDPEGEMFGFPRTLGLVGRADDGQELIDALLAELDEFTGAGWEQEDDITLVTLRRSLGAGMVAPGAAGERLLAELEVPSAPGNERRAIDGVAAAVAPLALPEDRLDRVKTAVGEAVMNAMEHGNGYREDLPVAVRAAYRRRPALGPGDRPGRGRDVLATGGTGHRGEARRAADPARLGAVPDRAHGRRDAGHRRRRAPHPGARLRPGGRIPWRRVTQIPS